ncbi:hypothetical protein [Microvirga yunnanensis]|uniref:hypothetical protein n=1 Tax=Microvirga yunnanensis TaxID=2953740 RepID=UPI0021C8F313|nr:hypothetical protein [Microvirga sp. HBU65207]
MSRTLKTRTRRLEQTSAASPGNFYCPVICAEDKADADRQMEALWASGALDCWKGRPFPVVRVFIEKPEDPEPKE